MEVESDCGHFRGKHQQVQINHLHTKLVTRKLSYLPPLTKMQDANIE